MKHRSNKLFAPESWNALSRSSLNDGRQSLVTDIIKGITVKFLIQWQPIHSPFHILLEDWFGFVFSKWTVSLYMHGICVPWKYKAQKYMIMNNRQAEFI